MSVEPPLLLPAARPCGSCPYRCDVPSGVWAEDEYGRLPEYDVETWAQPRAVFMCHRQDGRLCAGWAAVHDMRESFGVRVAALTGRIAEADLDALLDYTTDVPLFSSGAEAAEHGLRDVDAPGTDAVAMVAKLRRLRGRP